jgi:DNA-directed RNA polymerase subunit RPC12/RpoP
MLSDAANVSGKRRMQLQSLQCNHCGADVEVSPTTKFATCGHCGSRLAVVRTASSTYTELAEKVDQLSDRMQQHLDRLDRRSELEELDRRWALERENYMVSNKHGAKHIPTRSESAIAGTLVTVFGVFWTVMALGIGGGIGFAFGGFGNGRSPIALIPCIFPAFGVLIIGMGIYQSMNAYDKASRYERAKSRYEAERRRLMASRDDEAG